LISTVKNKQKLAAKKKEAILLQSICNDVYIYIEVVAKPMRAFLLHSLLVFCAIFPGYLAEAQVASDGKCLSFNGIDQYMTIPNHPDFNIAAGESYTITCRINPDNFAGPYIILSKGNSLMPGGRYELTTANTPSTPNLVFNLTNNDNTNLGFPYTTFVRNNDWVHVAWVYNGVDKSSKLLINGELVSGIYNGIIGRRTVENGYDLVVGCGWTDDSDPVRYQFWPGHMDELRIWKRVLTTQEVMADRNEADANTNNLVAAYNFENVSNNIVPDLSGKGHNAKLMGYGIRVFKTQLPVGMGQADQTLVGFRLVAGQNESIKKVTIDFTGTNDISDVKTVKVYHNGKNERFNVKTATLFGSFSPAKAKTTVNGLMNLPEGDNYFWITADIKPLAREGNRVQASVISYLAGDGRTVSVPDIPGSRTILLTHKLLYSGGDGGSKNYRIPAIVVARDGSLITATDKRWTSPYDLPRHIDILIRRSTDKGQTWSQPVTLAGEGTEAGFGDAALVLNRKNSEIICLFAANNGFYLSLATLPIRIYQTKSTNNGITWSTPQDITRQIYGAESVNPFTQTWQGAFVTSGSASQLKSGRLIAVMPVRENSTRVISNFVMYSDDNAQTWKVSPNRASAEGNEAKIVELESGNLLMSIRSEGKRKFNISKDQGMTWGSPYAQPAITDPSCNGDMIRYTAISSGYNKNRLLHSIPFSGNRNNISVLLSYDEGETWPVRKTIYPGGSAYSSLCVLYDGTIGMYYESGEYETYQMYFVRFSLEWLTDGADIWTRKYHGEFNSVDDIADHPTSITVFPNPADEVVNVSGTMEYHTPVEIYNAQGQLMTAVRTESITGPVELSVRDFSPGIYFVKAGKSVVKLVVK
jgi:hypothetical protein